MAWKNFLKSFNQGICEYFVESSIHGLRYLVDGKNLVEKVCWSLIIVTSIYLAGTMISTSIQNNNEEPILTTIETTSIINAPFPAITIAADDRINPWGFVEKTFNMLAFYGPDVKNSDIFDDSAELRKESKFIALKIFENLENAIDHQWKNWSLDDYKKYSYKKNAVDPPPLPPNTLKRIMKKVKQLVPKLAAIYLGNLTIATSAKAEMIVVICPAMTIPAIFKYGNSRQYYCH